MKCLLVNPERSFLPPLGLLYIASSLEAEGHTVRVIELPPLSYREPDLDALFRREIPSRGYDLVGLTCMSSHYRMGESLLRFCRNEMPDVSLVVGGDHASVLPEGFLRAGADWAVIGEGEETVCELVRAREGGGDPSRVNGLAFLAGDKLAFTEKRRPPRDLDALPDPAYHLVDMDRYVENNKPYGIRGLWIRCGWVFSGRGCIGRCKFCNYKDVHGLGVRYRGIPRVVDELSFLTREHRIRGFWILDDTFTVSERHVVRFCEELKKRGLGLRWTCQSRSDTLTEEMVRQMKAAGCVQTEFGVESGSQRVLDMMGKGITVEQTVRAFSLCKKYSLRTFANVMLGYPGETLDDMERTRELIRKIRPSNTSFFFACPYPGTELYREAVRNRWIDPAEIERYTHTDDPVMCVDFSSAELLKIRDGFWKDTMVFSLARYLLQPGFIKDVAALCFADPRFALTLFRLFFRGRRNDAINLLKDQIQSR